MHMHLHTFDITAAVKHTTRLSALCIRSYNAEHLSHVCMHMHHAWHAIDPTPAHTQLIGLNISGSSRSNYRQQHMVHACTFASLIRVANVSHECLHTYLSVQL